MATRIVPKTKCAMTSFPNTTASRDSAPLKHSSSCLLGNHRQAGGFLLLCVSQPSAKRSYGAGRPVCVVEVEARAYPLRQLQESPIGLASVSTSQAACRAPASEAMTSHYFLDALRRSETWRAGKLSLALPYAVYSLTRGSQRCLSLSLSKEAQVCPKNSN